MDFSPDLTTNVPSVSQSVRQTVSTALGSHLQSIHELSTHMPAAVDTSVLSIHTCTVQQPNSSKYLPSHIALSLLLKDRPTGQQTSSSHDEYPRQTSYIQCVPSPLYARPISVAAEPRRSDMASNTVSLPVRSSLKVGQLLIPVK